MATLRTDGVSTLGGDLTDTLRTDAPKDLGIGTCTHNFEQLTCESCSLYVRTTSFLTAMFGLYKLEEA